MGLIYKRTSPSGKYYIGLTTQKESKRWSQHIREARYYPNGGCRYLNHAINKYGGENFTLEILEDNIQTREELFNKEAYWIKLLNATNPDIGYNLQEGGLCGSWKKLYLIEDFLPYWEEGFCLIEIKEKTGVKESTIKRYLMEAGVSPKEFRLRGGLRKRGKHILQYTLEGEYIREWEKVQEITQEYDWEERNLYDCLAGGYSHFKGFLWKYADDERPISELVKKYNFNHSKLGGGHSVLCVETNEIFPSMSAASRFLGKSINYIRNKMIRGKTTCITVDGYTFKEI